MATHPVVSIDPAVEEQIEPWQALLRLVFQDPRVPNAEWTAARRRTYASHRVTAVMDGDRVAGTYRSWEAPLTVPGGSVTATLVSSVAVRQTHRRRGILTSLITADLAGSAERGVPVSILIGAEGGIYGRYGYGTATDTATWTVDVHAARLHAAAEALAAQVVVEDMVTAEELRPLCPPLFEATRLPGEIDRLDTWWDIALGLAPGPHPDERPGLNALVRDPATGEVEGVLRYYLKDHWVDRMPRSEITLDLLMAATPRAYAALWKYLVDQDVLATITAEDLSVEEPLPQLLTDPRAARSSNRCDLLCTRVLDPAALLAARRYESSGTAVIEVADDRGWAAGRFALEVAEDGTATCGRTSAAADVELPVATLGAVWLGGNDVTRYARAGLATELRGGGAARTSALLRTATAPFCGTWF